MTAYEKGLQTMQKTLELMEETQETLRQTVRCISQGRRHYRIYLVDGDNQVEAAEFFFAPDDAQAMQIAGALHDACSDSFANYELWQGGTPIVSSRRPSETDAKPDIEAVTQKHQDVLVELEERLRDGFARVRRSQGLLDRYARLRPRPV